MNRSRKASQIFSGLSSHVQIPARFFTSSIAACRECTIKTSPASVSPLWLTITASRCLRSAKVAANVNAGTTMRLPKYRMALRPRTGMRASQGATRWIRSLGSIPAPALLVSAWFGYAGPVPGLGEFVCYGLHPATGSAYFADNLDHAECARFPTLWFAIGARAR